MNHATGHAYCKQFPQARKWRQEQAALHNWAVQLPGTPELLAERSDALLLSQVPGQVLLGQLLEAADEQAIHGQAGAWLARMHALPHDDRDPLPLIAAIRQRAGHWLERASGLVEAQDLSWVADRLSQLDAAPDLQRVPCHRDYSPRNWLVERRADGSWAFGVIDFEHSRADCWLQDLDRLAGKWWLDRPDLREAFLQGYGREPDAQELLVADVLAAVNAVSTIAWAKEHGDWTFEAEGRLRLGRLIKGS